MQKRSNEIKKSAKICGKPFLSPAELADFRRFVINRQPSNQKVIIFETFPYLTSSPPAKSSLLLETLTSILKVLARFLSEFPTVKI